MYIEFKRSDGGNTSDMQKAVQEKLKESGHYVCTCCSLDEAIAEFEAYYTLPYTSDFDLYDAYKKGWHNDENIEMSLKYEGILRKAFRFGQADFTAGDDVSRVDTRSINEIISSIRGF